MFSCVSQRLHLSPEGYKIWADAITPELEKVSESRNETLQSEGPCLIVPAN